MKLLKFTGLVFVTAAVAVLSVASCKIQMEVNPDTDYGHSEDSSDNGNGDNTGGDANIIKYGTYNIEYNNAGNTNNQWVNRKYLVKNIFDAYDFDIVTIDEAYYSQLSDMQELIPGYSYYGSNVQGTTADKLLTVGILYKSDRFEIETSGKFWLSPTPTVKSKAFGMNQYRICNWALFKDKKLDTKFYVFATHIGLIKNGGEAGQREEIKVINNQFASIMQSKGKYPAFLSGDFNFDQRSDNYVKVAEDGIFTDSYLLAASRENPYQGTYNGYSISYADARIDHIFLANCNNFEVKSHHVITDGAGGKYGSDHYPVLIKVIIPTACKSSAVVKDTITEDFKYAVIQSDYLVNQKEVTPSGLWLFNGALVPKDAGNGDYQGMAPRLIGKNTGGESDLSGPGYIQTDFSLKGLKKVSVQFASMASGVIGPDFTLNVEVSTDNGQTWNSIGSKTVQKGEIGTAEFSPDIPGDKNVKVRLVNDSPDTGNLAQGNQINILKVTLINNL